MGHVAGVVCAAYLAVVAGAVGAGERCSIPQTARPPAIDGKLPAGEWDFALPLTGFQVVRTLEPAPLRQRAWMCYDADGLYVAFRTWGEDPAELAGRAEPRDGPFWHDDAFELLLAVDGDPKRAIQFVGNCAGGIYDSKYGKSDWNGAWRYRVSKTADGWVGEVGVSWKDLGVGAPEPETVWRMNVAHDDVGAEAGTASSWAPVRTDFHDVSAYSELVFAGPGPTAGVTDIDVVDRRPTIALRVANPGDADVVLKRELTFEKVDDRLRGSFVCKANAVTPHTIKPRTRITGSRRAELTVTDARGRVVLAHAFPVAKRYKARFVLQDLVLLGFMELRVEGPHGKSGTLAYECVDAKGATVLSDTLELPKGRGRVRIDAAPLPDGDYQLRATAKFPKAGIVEENRQRK